MSKYDVDYASEIADYKEEMRDLARDCEEDERYGYCSECGEKCRIITEDYGHGTTEFWGSVSTHHDYQDVSDCCEADVLKNPPEKEDV